MPVHNGEKYIAIALESVREQYCDVVELVIVDDGSSDRTVQIVREFSQVLPLRLISPGRVGSTEAATNVGLREATGTWACFLHSDDFWLPGRITSLRPEMEKSDGALILHNAIFVGPDGRNLGPWTCPLPEGVVASDLFLERLLVQNFVPISAPIFRRSAAVDSGGYDEALWFSADWDLWLRLGAMGPVSFIAKTLSTYRIHPEAQTVAYKRKPNETEQQLTGVLSRHLHTWPITGGRRMSVERAAKASIAVNAVLASAVRGEAFHSSLLLRQLLTLGPAGWRRFLRDSRIAQRVGSRLKVQGLRRPRRK